MDHSPTFRCAECGGPFTPDEWDDRHSRPSDGEDIHADCCRAIGCPAETGNLGTPAAQWLAEQFEFELCPECGGDEAAHDAIPVLGNWFARCREVR